MTTSATSPQTFVIGLVGGIASGKSHVAKLFQARGAEVIDADQLAHSILERPLNARRIGQMFGEEILSDDGSVSRPALATLVFGDDPSSLQRLKQLEQLLHPQVHAEAVKTLRRWRESESPPRVVVIDAPLLLEAGWAPLCDAILFVDTPHAVRLERARARGWSPTHFANREAAQLSLDAKRQQATHSLDSLLEEPLLAAAVDRVLAELDRR